ncbi:UDP-glucose 4-epimerase GalE [Microbulbifer aggregans]|uniref:UDP-glucose 4-epimerase GalE n=1 Tax=Microbulbifer aggregans TaxID=1769779 RepID=UPI001CFCD0B6|nr:UDP-glucose 4-epimerase GalE [Microbulbifer aggregans]
MKVVVTGGAGYIGSHTCVELLEAGLEPIVIDNLCNSSAESLQRVEAITGKPVTLHQVDIQDREGLRDIFRQYDVSAVIHFAGLKAVGESVSQPLRYYQNNVAGTLVLCEVMEEFGVRQLIFSSSATVYGDPASVPIREDFPTGATNPYGASKLMVEDILRDLCKAPGNEWKVSLLRYFNPIGAHESGNIGEDPSGIPNNLLPYVAQVAVGRLPQLQVFGEDYPTPDGTGVRDYIHVVDLARGHLAALNKLQQETTEAGCYTYNLGTGRGSSVLEIVRAFSEVSGKEIPYKVVPRRPGDIAECYADPEHAERELDWSARFDLKRMVEDTWRWQSKNPNGYS